MSEEPNLKRISHFIGIWVIEIPVMILVINTWDLSILLLVYWMYFSKMRRAA